MQVNGQVRPSMRRLGQGQHGVPANLSNEDIIREFETDYLVRPSFSTWTTAKSHQLRSLGGATLAVSGVFGCAWISWCDQGKLERSQPRTLGSVPRASVSECIQGEVRR